MNSNVKTNTEILWHKWTHTVSLKDHLTFKESTLRHARVDLFGLDDHDGFVFEEVVDEDLVDSEVFKA